MNKVQDEHTFKFMIVLLLAVLLPIFLEASTNVTGVIQKIGEATHLEFEGKSDWKYNLERSGKKELKLTLPAFNEKTFADLKLWSDRFIENIDISKSGPDGQYIVTFSLANESVESFDYLTDEPSRVIIDFYINESVESKTRTSEPSVASSKKSVADKKNYKKLSSNKNKSKSDKQSKNEYKKVSEKRSPSSSEILTVEIENRPSSGKLKSGVFDGGDPTYDRFRIKDYEIKEESIIGSRENIYIKFPIVKLKTSRLKEIRDNKPEYFIKEKNSKENKEARFLVTLFNNKRYAAYIKSFDYFVKEYPESVYDEILRNMLADVYFDRWMQTKDNKDKEKLISAITYLIEKYPDSVLKERSELTLAFMSLEHKDGISTIQKFLKFIDKNPKSMYFDQAKKSLSDGYLFLNKFDDALDVLRDLASSSNEKVSGVEALYRVGDVFYQSGNLNEAINSYKSAINEYPNYESSFENANYNLAESYFWTGQYKSALHHYIRFVELFPSHEHGGYALTRIGELLDILGADVSKSMGAFLESSYRFRKSEGSEVARVRMLSQKMRNMKEKEMSKALEEMNQIARESMLPRMEEFVTLMVADGLHRRDEYNKALQYLISYYQRNPTSTDVSFFRGRILKNISDLIKSNVDAGDFLSALKINSQYSTTWLNNLERIDIPFFIGQAYELAGAFSEAQKIYKNTLSQLQKIKGTREEKEKRVTEHLPWVEQVLLRLAQTSFQKREFESANDYLEKINTAVNLSGPQKVERVELLARVAEQKGDVDRAKKHLKQLISVWEGNPEQLAPTFLHLARLQYEDGNYRDAEVNVQEIENLIRSGAKLNDEILYKTIELKARTLEADKRIVAAIEAYTELLEKFESNKSMESTRYHLGKLMFSNGNIKGAEKIWNGLDANKSPMYVNLAQEKLNNAKWVDDYKRYIDRIPAAESLNRSLE